MGSSSSGYLVSSLSLSQFLSVDICLLSTDLICFIGWTREKERELTKYPEDEDGDEDVIILLLCWLNNILQGGRIRYLHVHPSRTKNLFSISEGRPILKNPKNQSRP